MVVVCGLVVFHRKIRLTQLWVELSWVVAIIAHVSVVGHLGQYRPVQSASKRVITIRAKTVSE